MEGVCSVTDGQTDVSGPSALYFDKWTKCHLDIFQCQVLKTCAKECQYTSRENCSILAFCNRFVSVWCGQFYKRRNLGGVVGTFIHRHLFDKSLTYFYVHDINYIQQLTFHPSSGEQNLTLIIQMKCSDMLCNRMERCLPSCWNVTNENYVVMKSRRLTNDLPVTQWICWSLVWGRYAALSMIYRQVCYQNFPLKYWWYWILLEHSELWHPQAQWSAKLFKHNRNQSKANHQFNGGRVSLWHPGLRNISSEWFGWGLLYWYERSILAFGKIVYFCYDVKVEICCYMIRFVLCKSTIN